MKEVSLTQGYVALVDDGDYDWAMQYKWQVRRCGTKLYASRCTPGNPSERRTLYMHRELLNPIRGILCDHVDGDGLNNQRENLRAATRSQNGANAGMRPNNTSGFKGVGWQSRLGKWRARLKIGRRSLHLGLFDNPMDAARLHDRRARELFGAFAQVNFPPEGEAPCKASS